VEGKSLALFVFLVKVEIVSSGALMRDPILLGRCIDEVCWNLENIHLTSGSTYTSSNVYVY
jgi:hypothetical protein